MFGNESAHAAKCRPGIDAAHVDPGRLRTGPARMQIGDQCQSCRDIKSLAHAHQRACGKHLIEVPGLTSQPCHCRPYAKAADDHPFATESIRDESTEWTQRAVNPKED